AISIDGGTATGTTTDNRASEDVNGNEVLDEGEDLNGNGIIDVDNGIYSIELSPESENLVLDVDPFEPGAGEVTFHVSLASGSTSGSGSVVVTDGARNT